MYVATQLNECWWFYSECRYGLQNSVKLCIWCCHWFHWSKKKWVCFFNMTELGHKLYEYILQSRTLYYDTPVVVHIIVWQCEETYWFWNGVWAGVSNFNLVSIHLPLPSRLKLNYELNTALIFIISILTFFSEVRISTYIFGSHLSSYSSSLITLGARGFFRSEAAIVNGNAVIEIHDRGFAAHNRSFATKKKTQGSSATED